MGLLLCDTVSSVPIERLLSMACGNEVYRGQAIVDILNYLCANCFNEIMCVPIGEPINDTTWSSYNGGCEADCGDIMVIIDLNDDIYSLYMRDNDGDWIQLVVGTEFRVGHAVDFVDDEAPTGSELVALFAGNCADHAFVLLESTKTMWFTDDKGITWDDIVINVKIAIENESTLPTTFSYELDTYGGAYTPVFSQIIYNNGGLGDTPLSPKVGDYVLVNVDFGYRITQYTSPVPIDNVDIQFSFTGSIVHTYTFSDLVNGFRTNYTRAFIATNNGDLTLTVNFRGTGNPNTFGANWEWEFFMQFINVTLIRNN